MCLIVDAPRGDAAAVLDDQTPNTLDGVPGPEGQSDGAKKDDGNRWFVACVHQQETARGKEVCGEDTLQGNEERTRFVPENLADFLESQHAKHRAEDEASIHFEDGWVYRHRDEDQDKNRRDVKTEELRLDIAFVLNRKIDCDKDFECRRNADEGKTQNVQGNLREEKEDNAEHEEDQTDWQGVPGQEVEDSSKRWACFFRAQGSDRQ